MNSGTIFPYEWIMYLTNYNLFLCSLCLHVSLISIIESLMLKAKEAYSVTMKRKVNENLSS